MTTDQAVKHYGSQSALARALDIDQSSVNKWSKHPPALRQLQIEALTAGALRAEKDCDKFRVKVKA